MQMTSPTVLGYEYRYLSSCVTVFGKHATVFSSEDLATSSMLHVTTVSHCTYRTVLAHAMIFRLEVTSHVK